MIKYTLDLPPDLRQAIDLQAAKELQVSPADVARRWLEVGRQVQEAGCETLAEFCKKASLETLGNWVRCEDDSC